MLNIQKNCDEGLQEQKQLRRTWRAVQEVASSVRYAMVGVPEARR